jgi:hypothetical protein
MKKLLIAASIYLFGLVKAEDLVFLWDPSPSTNVTYVLYGSKDILIHEKRLLSAIKVNAGTNTTATIAKPSGKWYFAVTAEDISGSSDFSNIVTNSFVSAPSNLKIVSKIYLPPSLPPSFPVLPQQALPATGK